MYKCPICNKTDFNEVANLFDDRYGAKGKYSIRFCLNCGFGKTYPNIKDEDIPDFYAKNYPLKKISVDDVIDSVDKKKSFIKWLLGTNNIAHQYVSKGKKVLDIGSASGVSLLEIKMLGSEGYGVEPDPNGQKLGRKLDLKVFKGLITDDPFPREKFDYVTGSQVLEHVNDPILFLESAIKKIKHSGEIIISIPNCDSIYRRIFGKRWINWHVPYHLNHFSKKSILLISNKLNLRIKKIRTITPNVWTSLQIAMLFNRTKSGSINPIWTGKYDNNFFGTCKRIFMNILIKSLIVLSTPFNRIIDFIGLGDSLLIILEKK